MYQSNWCGSPASQQVTARVARVTASSSLDELNCAEELSRELRADSTSIAGSARGESGLSDGFCPSDDCSDATGDEPREGCPSLEVVAPCVKSVNGAEIWTDKPEVSVMQCSVDRSLAMVSVSVAKLPKIVWMSGYD